jgi:signal transduction histidine kinase
MQEKSLNARRQRTRACIKGSRRRAKAAQDRVKNIEKGADASATKVRPMPRDLRPSE